MTDLLPCPFCGSNNVGLHYPYLQNDPKPFVTCQDCCADGPAKAGEAEKLWNARATVPDQPDEITEMYALEDLQRRESDCYLAEKPFTAAEAYEAVSPYLRVPKRESVDWQPLDTAPPGYTKDKGFEHILFKGYSKAGSFAGNVYISGWMDNDRKPVYEYSYKLVITGWKPLSVIEDGEPHV